MIEEILGGGVWGAAQASQTLFYFNPTTQKSHMAEEILGFVQRGCPQHTKRM